MDNEMGNVEAVTKSELLGLASWERQRSHEQLVDLINRRAAMVAEREEVEADDFDDEIL